MTGPEHYREAEALLTQATTYHKGDDTTTIDVLALSAAQVHATLALAAATAAEQATAYDGDERHERSRSWAGVA